MHEEVEKKNVPMRRWFARTCFMVNGITWEAVLRISHMKKGEGRNGYKEAYIPYVTTRPPCLRYFPTWPKRSPPPESMIASSRTGAFEPGALLCWRSSLIRRGHFSVGKARVSLIDRRHSESMRGARTDHLYNSPHPSHPTPPLSQSWPHFHS